MRREKKREVKRERGHGRRGRAREVVIDSLRLLECYQGFQSFALLRREENGEILKKIERERNGPRAVTLVLT